MGKASRRKKEKRDRLNEVWTPLEPARLTNVDTDEVGFEKVYMNDLYTVLVRSLEPRSEDLPKMTHLSFRRNDRKACIDWRHKQYIKNELCGEECEAVEVFPAESRLVDTSNQYHLWVFEEGYSLPFGFGERLVCSAGKSKIGAKQRPFETDMTPGDALSSGEIDDKIQKEQRKN